MTFEQALANLQQYCAINATMSRCFDILREAHEMARLELAGEITARDSRIAELDADIHGYKDELDLRAYDAQDMGRPRPLTAGQREQIARDMAAGAYLRKIMRGEDDGKSAAEFLASYPRLDNYVNEWWCERYLPFVADGPPASAVDADVAIIEAAIAEFRASFTKFELAVRK